jgi:Domain of unknown function (DUF397)
MADKGKAYLVEIDSEGLAWVKSSASANAANCVEVARMDGGRVVVRCSRARSAARLVCGAAVWARFIAWAVQRG